MLGWAWARCRCRPAADRNGPAVGTIPLYYFHRPDPAVPFARSVQALAVLLDEEVVGSVGVSNVNLEQLEVAAGIVPVAAVQNSFSPYDGSSRNVVSWCDAHEVPFIAWAPLGGVGRAAALGSDQQTRLHGEVARARGASVAQVVLAWLLARSPVVSVIPGARRPESIVDAFAAQSIVLDAAEIEQLDAQFDRWATA